MREKEKCRESEREVSMRLLAPSTGILLIFFITHTHFFFEKQISTLIDFFIMASGFFFPLFSNARCRKVMNVCALRKKEGWEKKKSWRSENKGVLCGGRVKLYIISRLRERKVLLGCVCVWRE